LLNSFFINVTKHTVRESLIYTNLSNYSHYITTYSIYSPHCPCPKIKINVTQAMSFYDHYFINLLASRNNGNTGYNVTTERRNYNFEINRYFPFKTFTLLPPDSA